MSASVTWTVDATEAGSRLDRFLARGDRLGSRARAVRALDRGQILVNDREVTRPATRVSEGDRVRWWRDRPGSASRRALGRRVGDLRIVYQDDTLLVVDKPAGLLTVPLATRPRAPSVAAALEEEFGARARRAPLVVHRIDRDTSGLVVFAWSREAWRHLKQQFARREPQRVYLAVVRGVPTPGRGTWKDRFTWNASRRRLEPAPARSPRALEAECHYRVLEELTRASLLEVRLVTGRRNQIRAQAALHGCPLVGDRQYGGAEHEAPGFSRQALHAHRLAFVHPRSREVVEFVSPLPPDLAALLRRLRRLDGG